MLDAKALAQPDNEADKTINLSISGNRLVSVLNALDGAMHALGRYRLKGNAVIAESPWYAELRETTEAIRDELSRQRCEGLVFYAPDYPESLVRQVAAENARTVTAQKG
jgi:hypothetical protein